MTPGENPNVSVGPAWRWRLSLLGVVVALGVMAALSVAGFEFRLGERDVTLALGLGIELAFGVWGFLLGRSYEARQAERRAARAARVRMDELAGLQARLARLETLASVGQLAGSIAHEIRNPLAIIRAMIQNLAEGDPGRAEHERACQDILEEVDRLARVTESVVRLARPVRPQLATVDLGDVLERAAWLARKVTEPSRQLRAPGLVRPACVRADPDLLCQVVLGLVANAARASPPGSAIDLEGGAEDGHAIVSVTDSGPGVPPDVQDRIFEPFFTTSAEGAGLGLAVARQIIDAHGGRITVEDAPGRGARFVIRLDCVEAPC